MWESINMTARKTNLSVSWPNAALQSSGLNSRQHANENANTPYGGAAMARNSDARTDLATICGQRMSSEAKQRGVARVSEEGRNG